MNDKEAIECVKKLKDHCESLGNELCEECCLRTGIGRCFVGSYSLPCNWEIPPNKIATDVQKTLFKCFDERYKWIAKDKNRCVWMYEKKPYKNIKKCRWCMIGGLVSRLRSFKPGLFDFLSWEDEEPTYIPDLLKEG